MARQETIIIIKGTVVEGKTVKPRQKVTCSAADARFLIATGKAKVAEERRGRPPKPEPKVGKNEIFPDGAAA